MKLVTTASVAALVASLALPALARAQKTSFDFDSTAAFSKFRTYAWRQGTPAGEHFLDKRIESAIDVQLAAKGLTKSDTNPDVYVLYHVALGVQKSVSGFGSGSGPFGWHGGLDTFDARLNSIPVGGLVIDLVDSSKRELVWQGVGVSEIDVEAKPQKRDAAIVKTVERSEELSTEVPLMEDVMSRSPLSVLAVSNDALRSELIAKLMVDDNNCDVIVVESIRRAYSRIREVHPNIVVLFMEIDDVDACHLLSMLSMDRALRSVCVVTCTTGPYRPATDMPQFEERSETLQPVASC